MFYEPNRRAVHNKYFAPIEMTISTIAAANNILDWFDSDLIAIVTNVL